MPKHPLRAARFASIHPSGARTNLLRSPSIRATNRRRAGCLHALRVSLQTLLPSPIELIAHGAFRNTIYGRPTHRTPVFGGLGRRSPFGPRGHVPYEVGLFRVVFRARRPRAAIARSRAPEGAGPSRADDNLIRKAGRGFAFAPRSHASGLPRKKDRRSGKPPSAYPFSEYSPLPRVPGEGLRVGATCTSEPVQVLMRSMAPSEIDTQPTGSAHATHDLQNPLRVRAPRECRPHISRPRRSSASTQTPLAARGIEPHLNRARESGMLGRRNRYHPSCRVRLANSQAALRGTAAPTRTHDDTNAYNRGSLGDPLAARFPQAANSQLSTANHR